MAERAWPVGIHRDYSDEPSESLVAKLEAYADKRSFTLSKWLSQSFREQKTKIGSAYSDWADIIHGISKGYLPGSLLFNDFIFLLLKNQTFLNFANNNNLFSYGSTPTFATE